MPASQPVPVEGSALVETCDVCIVGAGLAGLNALFVASQYLSRDQKVILVDRRGRIGGMWVDELDRSQLVSGSCH
jgi:cation diffusion facilitator CzcD-associated flavoprotein CzcO